MGHEGVDRQQAFVKAIPHTSVRLFSPSDLAARYDEQGLQIAVNKAKDEVERAARQAGIPITLVLPGNLAEFALNTKSVIRDPASVIFAWSGIHVITLDRAMGVDIKGNRIIFTGDSAKRRLNLW